MSVIETIGILFGVLAILIVIGVPLAYSLLLAGFCTVFAYGGINPVIVPQRVFAGIDSFTLLAIPFFLLAGSLMTAAKLSDKLIALCNAVVGRVKGGLAVSNIVTSIVFGGISGSAVADTSAIGGIFIPAMIKEGYSPDISVAVTAISSPLSPLVPPSIAWILYAYLADVSVLRMFAAGILPGLLWGALLCALVIVMAYRKDWPRYPRISFVKTVKLSIEATPALVMPIFILAGILLGIFTVTEASAIAVLYALFVGGGIYRTLSVQGLIEAIRITFRKTAMVMFLLATANIFGWILAHIQAPQVLVDWISGTTRSQVAFLLTVNIFLLLLGAVMEGTAAKVMLVPLLAPIAQGLGIDLIHFGVVVTVNLVLGLISPPVGIVLALASKIGGISFERGAMATLPFFMVGIVVLLLITFFPSISTTVPNLILGTAVVSR